MTHQLFAWEATKRKRQEGDRNEAKKRTMGLEDREEKREKKHIRLASGRQSCWLSILLHFKRILYWNELRSSSLASW